MGTTKKQQQELLVQLGLFKGALVYPHTSPARLGLVTKVRVTKPKDSKYYNGEVYVRWRTKHEDWPDGWYRPFTVSSIQKLVNQKERQLATHKENIKTALNHFHKEAR